MATLKQAALWYAEQGIPVFPLRPKTKMPATEHGFLDASTDTEVVRKWWNNNPDLNIGIATGHRFDVVDLDGPAARESIRPHLDTLPIVGRVQTARAEGGEHLLIPVSGFGNLTTKKHYPGVDFRGMGGYVVAAPSVVEYDDGHTGSYTWLQPPTLDAENSSVEHPFFAPFREPESGQEGQTRSLIGVDITAYAIDHEAQRDLAATAWEVSQLAEGGRNHALNAAAYHIGRLVGAGRLTYDEAEDTLIAAGLLAGLGESETQKTVRSGLSGGIKEPQPGDSIDPAVGELPRWAYEDLSDVFNGTYVAPVTKYLKRDDGFPLFYAGKIHWLQGESESGKSWVALLAVQHALQLGESALYLDYESDRGEVGGRLRALGVTSPEGFRYVRPEWAPTGEEFDSVVADNHDLVVIDGVTEAMSLVGLSGRDENDVASFVNGLAKKFERVGSCVILIDHVVKSTEGRGRMAIGSQHKLAAVTGAAYTVAANPQPVRGQVGKIFIGVAKDRPSAVRQASGARQNGVQSTAVVNFDSSGSGIRITIGGPEVKAETPEDVDDFIAFLKASGHESPPTKKVMDDLIRGARGGTGVSGTKLAQIRAQWNEEIAAETEGAD